MLDVLEISLIFLLSIYVLILIGEELGIKVVKEGSWE